MALTFDPLLQVDDKLRPNAPTIYGSYLYPDDLLRADRRDYVAATGGVTVATILASGTIELSGGAGAVAVAVFAATGSIEFAGSTTLTRAHIMRPRGRIELGGQVQIQSNAQLQASGTITFTGRGVPRQALPSVGTVQVSNQTMGIKIWTESL